ncbi:MAG: hypothetical protein K2M65_01900 [Muribaculaceae bacterium]|nr:hypothetical protein [Muribaculaceae bacterium]
MYADGTSVVVNAPQGTTVEVYSLAGIRVWNGVAPARSIELGSGIYVVRVGSAVYKLCI